MPSDGLLRAANPAIQIDPRGVMTAFATPAFQPASACTCGATPKSTNIAGSVIARWTFFFLLALQTTVPPQGKFANVDYTPRPQPSLRMIFLGVCVKLRVRSYPADRPSHNFSCQPLNVIDWAALSEP
jgi:hypothetical protein